MKKIAYFAVIALFVSCQQGAKKDTEVQEDPYAITCDGIGPIKLAFTHEDLVAEIGADKMEDTSIDRDGVQVAATRVFPDSPEEIQVIWAEESSPFQTIEKIVISHPLSPYQTESGVRVGSTLDELRERNNFMPVVMTNFYNNLDGYADIVGFSGGDLETELPCLGGKLDIVKQNALDVTIRDEARQLPELLSSHRIFSMLDVEVVELSITK